MKDLDIESALGDIFDAYTKTAAEAVEASMQEVAKDAVSKLKATSPKHTGNYAKGWRAKVQKGSTLQKTIIIHNANAPQLTHLLEHGHVKRGGKGRVAAIPHISPVEEEIKTALVEKIKEKLQ